MHSSPRFIAVGIGAILALSPVGTVSAQSVPPGNSSENSAEEQADLPPADSDDDATGTAEITNDADDATDLGDSELQPSPASEDALDNEAESDNPGIEPLPRPTLTPLVPGTRPTQAPALQNLDRDPNPLQFPTRPEDVQLQQLQSITLQQALELAQRNSQELEVARLELERSQFQLREAQAALSPTVGVGGNLIFQEARQQFTFPGQDDDGNTIDTILGGAIELNYNLFTSGRRPALIRAAERQTQFQELQYEVIAETLRLNVTNDYYDLQEADEAVRIAQAALEEALRSLGDAEALERAGVGTRFDVLQAEVDVANARQELTQSLSQQQVARRRLVQRLNLSQSANLAAADPVEVEGLWDLTLEESIVLAFRNRAELEQQLIQREVGEQQRQVALADLGPQVSLFANYSVQNQLNNTDQGFSDDYQFGARVNLNLVDGGAARARASQEEANIEIAESRFSDVRDQIRFQVEESYLTLQANFDNIQTASLALEQAGEALRLARLRFQAGVGTQTDVLRAQTELTRAEVNRLRAVLGYNRALAGLQRAVSNLPEGALGERP